MHTPKQTGGVRGALHAKEKVGRGGAVPEERIMAEPGLCMLQSMLHSIMLTIQAGMQLLVFLLPFRACYLANLVKINLFLACKIGCTVRHRGMGTGISEASKRVPIFPFAAQGGKQVSSYFRQRHWVQAREAQIRFPAG